MGFRLSKAVRLGFFAGRCDVFLQLILVLLSCVICLPIGVAQEQEAQYHTHPMEVFDQETIGNSTRISSVASDDRGRIFVTTVFDFGIFYFDGAHWKIHETEKVPSSLVSDRHGQVWVGFDGGVARIEFDKFGKLILDELDIEFQDNDNTELWSASRTDDGVLFYNYQLIVRVDNEGYEIERSDDEISFINVDESSVFGIVEGEEGVYERVEGDWELIKGLETHTFSSVVPYRSEGHQNRILALTTENEILVVDNGVVEPLSKSLQQLVAGDEVFSLRVEDDGSVSIGTKHAWYQYFESGKLSVFEGSKHGLWDNLVYEVVFTDEDDVWMANEFGITHLLPRRGIDRIRFAPHKVICFDYLRDGDLAYLGTNDGLIIKDLRSGQMVEGPGLPDGGIHQLRKLEGEFIAATSAGLYSFDETSSRQLFKGNYFGAVPIGEDALLTIGSHGHVRIAVREDQQKWANKTLGPRLSFECCGLEQIDNLTFVTFGPNQRMAIIEVDERLDRLDIFEIEGPDVFQIVEFGEEKFFLSASGLSELVKSDGGYHVVPAPVSPVVQELARRDMTGAIFQQSENRFVVVQCGLIELLEIRNGQLNRLGLWVLRNSMAECFPFWDSERNLVYCIADNYLNIVDLSRAPEWVPLKSPLVVADVGHEDLVESNEDGPVRLRASAGIRLEFSLPSSSASANELEYQWKLDGFEEDWSAWSDSAHKEYMNLPGGSYDFSVRARSMSNPSEISPTEEFHFLIDTPWYLTLWAKCLALFLGISLVFGIVSIRSRRLTLANRKMELLVKKRTLELRRQKDKVRKKSNELVEKTRDNESQRLESLSRMLGGIAHDFNNLLSVIAANSEILESNADESQRQCIEGIQTAGSTAAGLCSQLQSFLGTSPINRQTFVLEELISHTQELLRSAIPAELQLNLSLDDRTPPVFVDESEVRQVLLNLVINASETGCSKVRIRTGVSELSEADLRMGRFLGEAPEPGGYSWFEVQDDGPGINKSDLNQLFDPFYTTKRLGRGLGLSIVMRVVGRHQGVMFLTTRCNSKNSGTTFRVCFPHSKQKEFVEAPQMDSRKRLHFLENCQRLNILLVDDEPAILDSLKSLFHVFGHESHLASSGIQALACVQEEFGLDVALIDISMPEMAGTELAEEIHKIASDLPIVLMSGFTEQSVDAGLLQDSRIGFIKKPFSVREVSERLAEMLPSALVQDLHSRTSHS